MTAVPVQLRPNRQYVRDRLREIRAADPELAQRLRRLQKFSGTIRTNVVFLTRACDIGPSHATSATSPW